jgi:hypothetical protein
MAARKPTYLHVSIVRSTRSPAPPRPRPYRRESISPARRSFLAISFLAIAAGLILVLIGAFTWSALTSRPGPDPDDVLLFGTMAATTGLASLLLWWDGTDRGAQG